MGDIARYTEIEYHWMYLDMENFQVLFIYIFKKSYCTVTNRFNFWQKRRAILCLHKKFSLALSEDISKYW